MRMAGLAISSERTDGLGTYKNSEGYSDPTVGEAMSNIAMEARRKDAERLDVISQLIPIMKKTAELVGFEVVGRIVLMDKETGKKYK